MEGGPVIRWQTMRDLSGEAGIISGEAFRRSKTQALEFMLVHHLYRSDRTG